MLAAIIQARMGSTRLPGKTLAEVGGKPLIQHLVDRVRTSRFVAEVIIATTDRVEDDALVRFAERRGLKYFRGSEQDVLDRIYRAAAHYGVKHIVRVTPDCPLLDPRVMDRVIEVYQSGQYDYVSNTLQYSYPDGLDVEVFSFAALERAWKEAQLPSEREHVTTYIRHSDQFRPFNVESPVNVGHLKWSVDTEADLAFVRSVFARLGDRADTAGFEDVFAVTQADGGLTALGERGTLNHGYYASLVDDPPVAPRDIRLERSWALKSRAEALIPSGTQTFSKGPTQFVQGVAPVFLARGQGSHVWDVDGNEFIDYPMGLGPVILGHGYPVVVEAVARHLREGMAFSLPHPLELELAELLAHVVPCAEMVRFAKNGSDATTGAVRVARAYTGRDVVACCGYHGWHDWYVSTTTRKSGVPVAVAELTVPFAYDDLTSLERIFAEHPGQVAAVIMEPVGVVPPSPRFLRDVRDLTHRHGAVLIFDEIVTGFRLALGGAQEYFGVVPDLACLGKAMANGFPLSAVVGARDIMKLFDEVFFSFTFGGETLSLVASVATITELREKNVIGHLWEKGRQLKDGYNVLARQFGLEQYTECVGFPPRTVVTFRDAAGGDPLILKSLFQQECLLRGVLFGGGHNVCYSHDDADVHHTLRVYRTALEILADAVRAGDVAPRLKGAPVEPVFRQP